MKFNFSFANLLGTVYNKGNLLFTNDGDTVISPVGNRITLFDLRNSIATTLPIEADHDFTTLAISPSGSLLIAVTEIGELTIISLHSRRIVHKRNFMKQIRAVKFSPDGKHFVLSTENKIFVFKAPGRRTKSFEAFIIERMYECFVDETTCVDWSSDSRFLIVGSKDMTVKVIPFARVHPFKINAFTSHSDEIVGVFFFKDSLDCFSVSKNNVLCVWQSSLELSSIKSTAGSEDRTRKSVDSVCDHRAFGGGSTDKTVNFFYRRVSKHFLKDAIKQGDAFVTVTSCCFNPTTQYAAIGFSNGAFIILELPDFILIQSLSLDVDNLSTINYNPTGDWLALGSSSKGRLVVYEWQSEGFVLKQQGHSNNMTCLDYSPSGQHIITGGDDGKVKLWNLSTGFCFSTFSDHSSGVTAVKFTQNGKAVLSASYDGTVRATDVKRYRNFKTFTSPEPTQFLALCVDPSGEVVCASSQDTFEIFVWSMQTGKLVDVLAGHESPVSSLSFSPVAPILLSSSWDKTCKIWQMFTSKGTRETIQLGADCLAAEIRPDGKEFAVSTLDGSITIFDLDTTNYLRCIEGRFDLHTGRKDRDLITSERLEKVQAFTTLCYTADGECLLAAGRSKVICIFQVAECILLKKFEITRNLSLDGVIDTPDRRKMTEFGNLDKVELRGDTGCPQIPLPGSRNLEYSARTFKREVRVSSVRFSPTGREFAAVTTEGLLRYSLNNSVVFDPFDFEMEITSDSIQAASKSGDFTGALISAFRLNEADLIREVLETTPISNVELLVSSLPQIYIEKLLEFLAAGLEGTKKLEMYLKWIRVALMVRGENLKDRSPRVIALLKTLQKNIALRLQDLQRVCDLSRHSMDYVIEVNSNMKKPPDPAQPDAVEEDESMDSA